MQRRQHVQPPMLSLQNATASRKQVDDSNTAPHGEDDRLIRAPVYDRERSIFSSFDIERDKGTSVVYLEDEVDNTCVIESMKPIDGCDGSPLPTKPGNGVCGKYNISGRPNNEFQGNTASGKEPILMSIGAGSESDVQGCTIGLPGSPKKFYSHPPSYRSIGIDVSEPPDKPSYNESLIDSTVQHPIQCSSCGVLVDVNRVPHALTNGPVQHVQIPPKKQSSDSNMCTCEEHWNPSRNSMLGTTNDKDASKTHNENNSNCNRVVGDKKGVIFYVDNEPDVDPLSPAVPTQVPPEGLLRVTPIKPGRMSKYSPPIPFSEVHNSP